MVRAGGSPPRQGMERRRTPRLNNTRAVKEAVPGSGIRVGTTVPWLEPDPVKLLPPPPMAPPVTNEEKVAGVPDWLNPAVPSSAVALTTPMSPEKLVYTATWNCHLKPCAATRGESVKKSARHVASPPLGSNA